MTVRVPWGWLAALVAVLVLGGWVYAERNAVREARLEARNARAAHAETEQALHIVAGVPRLVHQRLSEEHAVELGTLEARLLAAEDAEATAHAEIRLLARELLAAREGATAQEDSAGVRTVADTLDARDSVGVLVWAAVSVPPPPAPSFWMWDLRRVEADVTLTLACAEQNAVATMSGPPWLPAEFTRVQQDDAICVPPVGWVPWSFELPSLPWAAGLVGAGAVLGALLAR